MRYSRSAQSLAVFASVVICSPVAQAQAQAPVITFHIPSGTLDAALHRYARVTGRQLLYKGEVVRGRSTKGVDGAFTADAALDQILRDTGLDTRQPATNVFVVEFAQRSEPSGQATPVADSPSAGDIVVTGSNIRGAAGQTAPLQTISRADLARSGRATFADAIAALPQNFGGTGNPVASLSGADRSTLNNSVAPAANLRGFGSDATLTLFNGRRVAGTGGRGDFTDLSAVPTLAVDRVEILTDGASAIYGSDAVGGVVNLILRNRLDGVEGRLRGTTATDGSFRNGIVGIAAGHGWSSGGILIAYEFEHRDSLSALDRIYTATGDLRAFGGTDHRSYLSVPGTLLSYDATARAYLPAYAIPLLPAGVQPTAAQIVPGSNLTNPLAGTDLSPGFDRHAVYAHADQALSSSLDAFVEGRYARRTFNYAGPASSSIFLVTPANPSFIAVAGAPFSVIAYSFANDLGATRTAGGVSSLSVTGGLTYRLGTDWTVDGYGSFSRERSHDRTDNLVNTTSLDEALGNLADNPLTAFSTRANGFFNPYGSGSLNSTAILGFVGNGFAALNRRSSIAQGALKADGTVLTLPGGPIKLAIGGDVRRETFARGGQLFYSGDVPIPASSGNSRRDVKAAFAELDLPLVGPDNGGPGLRRLVVSAAVRHEEYSDFGGTTNPKIGIAWTPAIGILLRSSWGTSFRAPALPEINDRLGVGPTQLPTASGTYVPVIYLTGGNPALGAERARSFTAGAVIEPSQIPGLRITTNIFSTRFRDQIGQPAFQDILHALTNPALSPYVQTINPSANTADLARVNALLATPGAMGSAGIAPTAFQAIVDARYVNTSSLVVSGLDGNIHLARPLGRGRLDLDFAATWLFTYDATLTPLSAVQNKLDTTGNPSAIRFRTSATWTHGILSATGSGNYVNGYLDNNAQSYGPVSAFFTLDANAGIAPTRGVLKGSRFALSVENALNAKPPFVNQATGLGFDAANASPFGRTIAIEITTKF